MIKPLPFNIKQTSHWFFFFGGFLFRLMAFYGLTYWIGMPKGPFFFFAKRLPKGPIKDIWFTFIFLLLHQGVRTSHITVLCTFSRCLVNSYKKNVYFSKYFYFVWHNMHISPIGARRAFMELEHAGLWWRVFHQLDACQCKWH